MEKMITISHRTDIYVPAEYRRTFDVPADAKGEFLVEKIKEKCGLDWKYLELTVVDFRHATFDGVDFRLVDVYESDFRDTDFNGVSFVEATIKGADFTGARFDGVDFYEATIVGVRFIRTEMNGVFFTDANLRDNDFTDATINGSSFIGATIKGVGFIYTNFNQVVFTGAKIKGGTFNGAKMVNVSFREAALTGSSLRNATLTLVDFADVNLTDTNFKNVTLTGVENINFSGTFFTCCAKHERVILIPDIKWRGEPIAAIMPEGDQPLLISIGCQTHTPEAWENGFTVDQLESMHNHAPEWHKKHMAEVVRLAKELEKEFLNSK